MTNSERKITSLSIVAMFLLVSLLAVLPTATAQNDPPNNHAMNHWAGTWIVEDKQTFDGNTEIVMDNGNVIVKDGGILTLDNAVLYIDNTLYGQHGITVQSGGQLIMKNNALIRPWTPSKAYYMGFLDGSTIALDSSTIFGPGGNVPGVQPSWTYGIYIGSKNVTMDKMNLGKSAPNNNFVDIMNGGHLVFRNSTMDDNVYTGIYVDNGIADIYDSIIQTGGLGGPAIYTSTQGQVNLVKTDIGYFPGTAIYMYGGKLDMKESQIHNNGGNGIEMYHMAKAILINNTIAKNNDGLVLWDSSEATLTGKNVFDQNANHGIYLGTFSKVTSTGTIISKSGFENVYVQDFSEFIAVRNTFTAGMFDNNVIAQNGAHIVIRNSDMIGGGNGMGNAQVMAMNGCSIKLYNNSMANSAVQVQAWGNNTILAEDNYFADSSGGFNFNSLGDLTSRRNTFKNVGVIFYGQFKVNMLSEKDLVNSGDFSYIGQVWDNSALEIHKMTATLGNPSLIGIAQADGDIRIYDSTFTLGMSPTAPIMIADGANAHFLSINSTPNKLPQTDAENGGIVEVGYRAEVLTQWQNSAAAPNAQVTIKDHNGKTTHAFNSGANAKASIVIIDFTNTSLGLIKHNPYSIKADLNGMTGTLNSTVVENKLGAKAHIVKILDTAAPFVSITSPVNGLITNAHSIDISGSVLDNGSGIKLLEAKVGTGVWKPINGTSGIFLMEDYGLDLDGDEMIASVRATDNAGLNYTAQVKITVDWTLPTISVAEPTGQYVKTAKFNLTGTTDPNATLKIDGAAVTVGTDGKFIQSFDKQDGKYNITLVAVDKANNTMTVHKLITVDTVAPVITTNIPTQTYKMFPGLRLQGTLTDVNTPLELTVNSKNATIDQTNHTWYIDLTLVEGPNNVSIQAKDPASNIATKTMVINLDSVAPVINVTSPKGPYPFYSNKLNQTITGKVIEKNLKSFTVNGKNVSVDANGSFSVDLTLVAGQNHVNLSAEDMVADSFFDVFIEVSSVAPTIVITSPLNGLVTKNPTLGVAATVTGQDPAPNVTMLRIRMRNDQPTVYTMDATLTVGQNVLRVNATDRYGNTATATVTVIYDNEAKLTVTKPTKDKISTTTTSITISGTSETGAKIYVNDVMITSDQSGTFTYKMLVKEGKTKIVVKSVDPAGNTVSKTLSATRTEAKQYNMSMLLGLGIVLMIIGLIIGVVIGKVVSKPKAQPPLEEVAEVEKAPSKPVTKPEPEEEPATEDKPFTPEEEPEEPAPIEKGSLKDKQKDVEAKPTESETKPEPKISKPTVDKPSNTSKALPKNANDDSLEGLLKGLEKKK